MMASFYVYNNVGIAFRCFATGILFGLGSIFFLVYNGLCIGVVAGAVGVFPLMVRGSRRAFQTRNLDYENAARSLGASEWRVFWRIALPLAYEPILAAAAIAFARVLTEFAAVVLIAFALTTGISPFPVALVSVIVVIALGAVYISNRLEHEGRDRP